VPDVDIGTVLTSQQCHMSHIGTPASFELVWYHAIKEVIVHSISKVTSNSGSCFAVLPAGQIKVKP